MIKSHVIYVLMFIVEFIYFYFIFRQTMDIIQ